MKNIPNLSNQLSDSPERDEAEAGSIAAPSPLNYARIARHLPAVTIAGVTALAAPAIVEQLLNAAIGLTDTVIAGHLHGNDAVRSAAGAAVGVMTYLQWFCGLMTGLLGTGATAVVARSIGARRPRVANRVAGTAVSAAFLVGLAVSTILFVFAEPLVHACRLHGLAAIMAVQYLQIMVVTVCFQTAAQIGMSCLRGAGDTISPMFITAAVAVINFFTSTAFTFGWFGMPAWGLRGDAFGTLLAYLTGGIATGIMMLGGWSGLKLQLRHLRVVPHVLMRILRISLPSWFEGVLLWGGQFLIVILVLNNDDPAGVRMAAHMAVLRIESLSFLPGFGFGIAASALVGQYLGAKQPEQAKRGAFIATWLACLVMTIIAIPMGLFPGFLLRLIINSAPVVKTGFWPMILAGLAQPAFAIAIGFSGALKGAGETVWPMMTTLLGIFAVRIPIVVVFCLTKWHWGLTGLWVAIAIDLAFRGGMNSYGFLRGKWQEKVV